MNKIFFRQDITVGAEIIGYLQLVNYLDLGLPHIEYKVNPLYWGKGVMRFWMPKYLQRCKEAGYEQLIALVHGENPASIKLLKRNGFVEFSQIDDTKVYLADLKHKQEDLEQFVKEFKSEKGCEGCKLHRNGA